MRLNILLITTDSLTTRKLLQEGNGDEIEDFWPVLISLSFREMLVPIKRDLIEISMYLRQFSTESADMNMFLFFNATSLPSMQCFAQ